MKKAKDSNQPKYSFKILPICSKTTFLLIFYFQDTTAMHIQMTKNEISQQKNSIFAMDFKIEIPIDRKSKLLPVHLQYYKK